jgi:hypothetical protein
MMIEGSNQDRGNIILDMNDNIDMDMDKKVLEIK